MVQLLVGFFTSIGGYFASTAAGVSSVITVMTLLAIARKALLYFLIGVVLPLVLYNLGTRFIVDIMEFAVTIAAGQVQGQNLNLSMQITGMAGWIANQIYLPQCLSIIFAAIAAKFAMGFIPGLR
jgi:hypothetical protein